MKISKLIERLEIAKQHLGDVEVYGWDSSVRGSKEFPISCIDYEGDHIELTD